MKLTKAECVLLQIARFNIAVPTRYNMPYGLTQDGIAVALCMSTAHVSLVLKALVEKGDVFLAHCHTLKGYRTKKVYALTQPGRDRVASIKEVLDSEGVDPNSIFSDRPQRAETERDPQLELARMHLRDALDRIESGVDDGLLLSTVLEAAKALAIRKGGRT